MSDHYCCKKCGLRYDDCTCPKEHAEDPVPLPPKRVRALPLNSQLDGRALRGMGRALKFMDQRPLEVKVAVLTHIVEILLEHAPERVRERVLRTCGVGANRA